MNIKVTVFWVVSHCSTIVGHQTSQSYNPQDCDLNARNDGSL